MNTANSRTWPRTAVCLHRAPVHHLLPAARSSQAVRYDLVSPSSDAFKDWGISCHPLAPSPEGPPIHLCDIWLPAPGPQGLACSRPCAPAQLSLQPSCFQQSSCIDLPSLILHSSTLIEQPLSAQHPSRYLEYSSGQNRPSFWCQTPTKHPGSRPGPCCSLCLQRFSPHFYMIAPSQHVGLSPGSSPERFPLTSSFSLPTSCVIFPQIPIITDIIGSALCISSPARLKDAGGQGIFYCFHVSMTGSIAPKCRPFYICVCVLMPVLLPGAQMTQLSAHWPQPHQLICCFLSTPSLETRQPHLIIAASDCPAPSSSWQSYQLQSIIIPTVQFRKLRFEEYKYCISGDSANKCQSQIRIGTAWLHSPRA